LKCAHKEFKAKPSAAKALVVAWVMTRLKPCRDESEALWI
jgi:hypothetical protein